MDLFYLSFSDPDRPKGTQFLGVCVLRGESLLDAANRARDLGANPGGEIMGHAIEPKTAALIEDGWQGRLLTRPEVALMIHDVEERQRVTGTPVPPEAEMQFVCKAHNVLLPEA